jgi:predicted nucleotidyltransferase
MKLASVESIVRALNDASVPFIVAGGLAVVAHGYGRQTQDLDLVVRLEPDVIRRAFRALAALGYQPRVPITGEGFADPAQRARWIAEKGMTVLSFHSDQHRETPVDVFVEEPFDFRTEYDLAFVEEVAPGVPARIVRLETLLRLKREAGRPQDLADIAELTLLHGGSRDGG